MMKIVRYTSISIFLALFASLHAELAWKYISPTTYKDYTIQTVAVGNTLVWALAQNSLGSLLLQWNDQKNIWEPISKNPEHVLCIAATDHVLYAFQKKADTATLIAWNGSVWQELYNIEHARIGSVASVDMKKIYAVVNEKVYELYDGSWKQLGQLDGFREVIVQPTGKLYARYFDLQSALQADTAFPAFSLQLLTWNGTIWDKMNITLPEKELGLHSIALFNNNEIACVAREENGGGRVYTWSPTTQKLELIGDRSDIYTITGNANKQLWGISWAEQSSARSIYALVEHTVLAPKPPSPPMPTQPASAIHEATKNIPPQQPQELQPKTQLATPPAAPEPIIEPAPLAVQQPPQLPGPLPQNQNQEVSVP